MMGQMRHCNIMDCGKNDSISGPCLTVSHLDAGHAAASTSNGAVSTFGGEQKREYFNHKKQYGGR